MRPSLDIVGGVVSPDDEHIAFSYGSFDTDEPPFPIVARASPPRNGVIALKVRKAAEVSHADALRPILGRALLLIVMEWPRTCDEEIVAREGAGCIRFLRSSLSVREKRRLAPWESSPECVFHAEDRVVRSA